MKQVTLKRWAKINLDPPVSIGTLRGWAKRGCFNPAARKMGRDWRVPENAEYREPKPDPEPGSIDQKIRAIIDGD